MQTISLPDPIAQPEFYQGTAVKRFFSWMIDLVIIFLISAVIATLPFFIGWFFFPLIFLATQMIYCIGSLSRQSSTPGMRLMNIELRGPNGGYLQPGEAALHTIAYVVSMGFVIPQLITLALIMISPKGQGLHDLIVGATVINVPSKYSSA
ncbi:MAG: RDD family protein [Litoreibacter sp.]